MIVGVGESARGVDVAVVIPCYQAEASIERVVRSIGPEVRLIVCVDDASRDGTKAAIARAAQLDGRVRAISRGANGGVGAATIEGYRAALEQGAHVLVKIDADGQIDPALIPSLIEPILSGVADYAKGNRFFSLDSVRRMPTARLWGNAALSFLTKLSTGYWNLFDPSNGFTAIHADVARALPLNKVHRRYFFEADMLFRLGTLRAHVVEFPMEAVYDEETSHLSLTGTILQFPLLHARNLIKRIFYNHFLRNFSLASLNLVIGLLLVAFGTVFGIVKWGESLQSGIPATAGTVMLSGLPVLVGIQLLLSFLAYDIAMVPNSAVHRLIRSSRADAHAKADR